MEGNKYDTSVAAAVVVHKFDMNLPLYRQTAIFGSSSWTPNPSTLQNLVEQVDFALLGLVAFMAKRVQKDSAVGLDESSCRMLMPREIPEEKPGDLKLKQLIEKIREAKAKGEDSIIGRKNWLFVASVPTGERAARLMTIVSSAMRRSLDVWKYLKELLDRLLAGETDYSKLLPDVWKQEYPEAIRSYREEENRYKSDRKQITRARRVLAAKLKGQQT